MIDWLVPFLNILCVVVPPITGAMLADFYILKNADNYRFELMDKIPNVRPDTSIGAIVGCLVDVYKRQKEYRPLGEDYRERGLRTGDPSETANCYHL